MVKQIEDATGHQFGIDAVIASELLLDGREKLFLVASLERLAGGIPAFEVKPAHQHRQLGAQLRSLLNRQPIAQRVQGRAQSQIGFVLIWRPLQHLVEIGQPAVGFMDRTLPNR